MKSLADEKRENVRVSADVDPAKQSLTDLIGLVDDLDRKIQRVSNAVADNNGQISIKNQENVQGGLGQLNELRDNASQYVDQYRANPNSAGAGQLDAMERKLEYLTQSIENIRSNHGDQLNSIANARTSMSSAFNNPSEPYYTADDRLHTHPTDFGSYNREATSYMNANRSDIHNLNSTVRREAHRYSVAEENGYISYNRNRELGASISSAEKRLNHMSSQFEDPESKYSEFQRNLQQMRERQQEAHEQASSPDATRAQTRFAAELDAQVKNLEKVNDGYEKQKEELDRTKDALEDLKNSYEGNNKGGTLKVGADPNSVGGMLKQRAFSITRGSLAAGIGAYTGAVAYGTQQRLSAFDDIKSTAYANGGQDNRTLNTLGDRGFRYGYSGADMAGFAGAYTSSTGNTGSINSVADTAQAWARQSRVTGANEQSTQQLETDAGDAVNLDAGQMRNLGNTITNSIINSNMSAKATQQQQGLAMLYQNGQSYGMTASDERNMAGFQASMSRYGSMFQGQQGAQNTMNMASTLGNYNNPEMRRLLAMSNPKRYQGINGNVNMIYDMQDFQKEPWKMRDMLRNINRSYNGDTRRAAADLSRASGYTISARQAEKWINDANNGSMNKKQFQKYVKSTTKSKNADNKYDKTGTSKVQKNEAALANSAMKASQALDKFVGALAKLTQAGGATSPFVGGLATFAGTALGQVGSAFLLGSFKNGRMRKAWDVLKATKKGRTVKETAKVLGHTAGRKGASEIKRAGSLFEKVKNLKGVSKLGRLGSKAGKLAKKFPYLDAVFAGGDLLNHGHWLDAIADFTGVGSLLSGSKFLHGIEGSWNNLFKGNFHKSFHDAQRAWSKVPIIGNIYRRMENSKFAKEEAMKHMSVKDAKKAATKLNRHEAKNPSLLRRAGRFALKHRKGLLLGATGAGLAGLFGETAHASSRKHRKTSESWRILRGYNKMLEHAMRVVQAAKSIKNGGDGKGDDKGDDADGTAKAAEKWKDDIKKAAKAMGQKVSDDQVNTIVSMIAAESGGDPTVTQKIQDRNSAAGTPAQGLLQFVPSTFNSFAVSGHKNIKSGYDQLLALFNDSNWASDIHPGGGWGPTGHRIKNAIGGVRNHATGMFIASDATDVGGTDVYGEAGTEAYVPLNAGHYTDGLQSLKQLAGMFGKSVVDSAKLGTEGKHTTISPNYNINLTIQGGTDDANSLAETVANKVKSMLQQYDQAQVNNNMQQYYANETSGQFV